MELTEEQKKELLADFIKQTKDSLVLEAKADLEKINKLIIDQRAEYDKLLEGKITAADYKAFETKSLEAEKDLKKRVDEIETKMARPPIELPGGETKKDVKPGQMEYKSSFFNFFRSGRGGEIILDEAGQKYDMERKALVSNATGQILIPEDTESEIYRALPNLNVIRQDATIRTITGNRIRRRSMTEVTMGYGKLELGSEPAETDVVPSQAWQYVEDLEGLARIGKDELADSDVNIEAMIIDSFSRAQARVEETNFVIGTGHDNEKPEGILDGSTITRITSAAANAIAVDDVLNLIYGVPAQYRRNGKLYVASSTELAMRLLKSSVEHLYLWQPSVQAGRPATFAGYPVVPQEDIPTIDSDDECDIAFFGDVKAAYRIIDRKGMTIQRLFEKWALAGLIGILVSARNTGGVIRADALRVLREHA